MYFLNIQFTYKWSDYQKTDADICYQRVNAVEDAFVSVFSRFSAQIYKQYRRKEKDCFTLFACTYMLLSIEIGLVRFGYIDKGIN